MTLSQTIVLFHMNTVAGIPRHLQVPQQTLSWATKDISWVLRSVSFFIFTVLKPRQTIARLIELYPWQYTQHRRKSYQTLVCKPRNVLRVRTHTFIPRDGDEKLGRQGTCLYVAVERFQVFQIIPQSSIYRVGKYRWRVLGPVTIFGRVVVQL